MPTDRSILKNSEKYSSTLLDLTGAKAMLDEALIQSLWSGYGKILRVALEGSKWPTVIVKLVTPPTQNNHPRGWNTDIGHQRKLRSYKVEEAFYRNFIFESEKCKMARFIGSVSEEAGQMMVMEDLDGAGFPLRKQRVTLEEIKACLSWLAHFHAHFLGKDPFGLWEQGTYWHLDTRPEELRVMRAGPLKTHAKAIDAVLQRCKYRTFVHGDAKLANFCFARDGRVAAVDFQYVGGGCGMKDVAYFLSSCMDEDECARHETDLLNHYFEVLGSVVNLGYAEKISLEKEWRALYPMAWADFTRFLEGWMPTHHKLHRYSRDMVAQALRQL